MNEVLTVLERLEIIGLVGEDKGGMRKSLMAALFSCHLQ